ncbi:(Fe-S)-binding protein [Bradyrhizobium sp.]|uniref:(Fe-S)-binding protein n=1 Tax=Bradyrhizobium sp. TaxID=376 RepID=UPI0025BEA69C|nr:(Fe-S)-binding protein [Bradyrhizobium sp.]
MEQFAVVGIAGGFMAGLGTLLAGMLAVANRRLFVHEDPRIDAVEALLPKSNCGACGMAGCRNFAEQAVAGDAAPAQCTVSSPAQTAAIAALLGVAVGEVDKRVARLACAGGRHVAFLRARYVGLSTCRAAAVVSGGGKECVWGCLGLGDCTTVCTQGAITLDMHGLPTVDMDKCTACNDCVEVCPKGLLSLQLVKHRLWVACHNRAEGDLAEAACEVACTACGKCVTDAAPGLLTVRDNLVDIDPARIGEARREAIDRCATGAIVWYDDAGQPQRGVAAKKILRQGALPLRS